MIQNAHVRKKIPNLRLGNKSISKTFPLILNVKNSGQTDQPSPHRNRELWIYMTWTLYSWTSLCWIWSNYPLSRTHIIFPWIYLFSLLLLFTMKPCYCVFFISLGGLTLQGNFNWRLIIMLLINTALKYQSNISWQPPETQTAILNPRKTKYFSQVVSVLSWDIWVSSWVMKLQVELFKFWVNLI